MPHLPTTSGGQHVTNTSYMRQPNTWTVVVNSALEDTTAVDLVATGAYTNAGIRVLFTARLREAYPPEKGVRRQDLREGAL